MKRRNADCGKIRRPIKRNKITEGMYGSTTVLYLKFLILWAIVITADFMFMFRFEFLWPFWLLLRSVHDSFKYKGLAFSVLFVCIAVTSDLVCLFFIPVHWLLFAASTYVWVQYVWHTDKGICLPTIILWILFVYLEAGIRWKDSRHMPHLDLCRPFAAHCIGYPVVTLGFGFKSYIGYRMRQRKQREVAKENEFYMQLLQQALPQDESISSNNTQISNDDSIQQNHQNGSIVHCLTSSTGGQLIGAVPVAQQVQILQNSSLLSSNSSSSNISLTNHHQHHHHSSSSVIADNSSNSNIYHTTSDVQIGQMLSTSSSSISGSSGGSSSSSTTATIVTSSTTSTTLSFSNQGVANATSNYLSNHNNLNNINNYSSSKTAQNSTNKLNNNLSNSSTQFSVANTHGSTTVTSNGHVSNGNYISNNNSTNNKNSRKSGDKDSNKKYESNIKSSSNLNVTGNNYHEISKDIKQDTDWMDSTTTSSGVISSSSSTVSLSSIKADGKENMKSLSNGVVQVNNIYSSIGEKETISNNSNHNKTKQNGNVPHLEIEDTIVDPPERTKGRKGRSKRGDNNLSTKDNHNNNNSSNNNNSTSNNTYHHHNNHHSKDSHGNSDTSSNSSSSSSAVSTASATITNLASQIVTKICDTCFRLEAEVKKYRAEISHMKQIENELRQKLDSNVTTKSCLQAKQRECDDLDKRLHEMQNTRQIDLMNLQNVERRLSEERRQRQSLEAQLNNEKKARKTAEEKAIRPECSDSCKQRKQQIDNEIKQLRREIKSTEEAKQTAEQQSRKYEQDLKMFEAEVRNREAQHGTDRLLSALSDMQYRNNTLEKNLSAETRVKLDLFSALGEAKRQLEIKDNLIRNKDNEVHDLKAKIAQLLAIMPTDTLCLSSPCPTTGPSSPMLSLSSAHQQIMTSNHPLNSRGGPTSVVSGNNVAVVVNGNGGNTVNGPSVSPSNSVTCNTVNNVKSITNNNCSQNAGNVSGNVVVNNMVASAGQPSSNLDPNATAYTPKNSMVGGSDA